MLAHYGSRLSTVEINNTFYRMPKESALSGWVSQVPPSFRFVLKASRATGTVRDSWIPLRACLTAPPSHA